MHKTSHTNKYQKDDVEVIQKQGSIFLYQKYIKNFYLNILSFLNIFYFFYQNHQVDHVLIVNHTASYTPNFYIHIY